MTQAEKGEAENGKEKGGEKEKEQRGVKRPIVPALVPESLQEVRRRGRASDSASGPGGAGGAGRGEATGERPEASGPHPGGWCKAVISRSLRGHWADGPVTASPPVPPTKCCTSPFRTVRPGQGCHFTVIG